LPPSWLPHSPLAARLTLLSLLKLLLLLPPHLLLMLLSPLMLLPPHLLLMLLSPLMLLLLLLLAK
jgi:hypothetical protein